MKNELLQDLENRFETLKHIRNLAQSYDEKLFCYLLEQSTYKNEFKNRFFIMRNNTYIFKLNDFLTFLDLRNLSGSFTSYTNKIGLGFKTKSFLKTNNEVVLNFAYKDGVIKGGQSKDEDKKNEIFFNEILAKDEIDVLFARKALQNFELIGQGDLKENLNNANLLIKGNNLLALHSLKKKFANKVKLIYIDPPYNTGNDSFNYNDNFNHSTWLTFMKNRLEIARDFLRDDGVIFISIDEYESHYCKVLMDEIFGRDNFVGDFIRKTKSTTNDSKIGLNYQHEFLLCYAKNKNNVNLLGGQKDLSKYQNPDNDPFGAWVSDNPSAKSGDPKTGYFAVKNPYTGKEDYPPEGRFWLFSQNTIQRHIDEGRICFKKEHKDDERGFIYKRYLKDLKTTKKTFDSLKFVDNAFMNQVGTKEFVKLFGDSAVFKNPKPESLIYEILNHTTNENDLVMDFFAGSGTTLAVAMKMKRQFIGIEQMDYIESITKERLKKVVSGEQGGISKAVDWQGGGSFIYAELMPLNAIYKERIKNINDEKMLDSIYKDLESKAFLDYRIDLDSILKDKEFKELDLQEKKEVLLDILDSNMDYVLYGDIEDEDYAISSEVIELNKIFYGDDNV
ncbi:site-specific DNA-methyltransferase [Campylobacter upsaliensis]|uniref:site-specific DNA-methyltransferase n=1 Tax=Campylobacter upsaliensis TaxID=28080 RepID=UPI0022EACB34|nr:site-specific DNA-methyltransferase [Campylobacter upsaliensis]